MTDTAAAMTPAVAGSALGHGRSAVVAAVAAVALGVAAGQSALALLVVIAVLQAALVVSWVVGTGMPGRIGGLLIGAGAAAGADVAASIYPDKEIAPLLIVLGLAIPAMFVHQLSRGVVRVRTVESLSKVALLVIAVTALPSYLQLRHLFDGADLAVGATLAAGTALLVGHLADMVWSRPRFDAAVPRGLLAVVLGAVAGAAAGTRALQDVVAFSTLRSLYVSLAIGAVAGLLAVAAAFMLSGLPEDEGPDEDAPPRRAPRPALLPVAAVLLPLALTAPLAFLLAVAGNG